jgi:hypothetical protein
MLATFLEAIHARRKVLLTFYSKQDERYVDRLCAPMDFGPSRRHKDGLDRLHLWDLESSHTLSLPEEQVEELELLPESFDPGEFVTWKPQWFIERDWGSYS